MTQPVALHPSVATSEAPEQYTDMFFVIQTRENFVSKSHHTTVAITKQRRTTNHQTMQHRRTHVVQLEVRLAKRTHVESQRADLDEIAQSYRSGTTRCRTVRDTSRSSLARRQACALLLAQCLLRADVCRCQLQRNEVCIWSTTDFILNTRMFKKKSLHHSINGNSRMLTSRTH